MSNLAPGALVCKEVVELIDDYLEGRLPHADRTRFEQHLVTCIGCREYLRQLRATVGAAREVREPVPREVEDQMLEIFRRFRKP